MDFPAEEVRAAANRYVAIRDEIHESTEPNFGLLADLYTEDAIYYDASWGRMQGSQVIAAWLVDSMVGLDDWRFPVEFVAISGNNVVVKWTQIIPGTKPDGSGYTQSAFSRLIYAGNGKFSYEEDIYDMAHVLEDVAASGWRPTVPMNVPPRHPDRNWQPANS
jgi:hypothetical protein